MMKWLRDALGRREVWAFCPLDQFPFLLSGELVEQLLRPRSEGNPKMLTGGILAGLGSLNNWRGW
jgi:hypothetical protein